MQITAQEFKKDLDAMQPYLALVIDTGSHLKKKIARTLHQEQLSGEPIIVGSTNPDRLTTAIDPRSPDERYPADFDIIITTEDNLPADQQRQTLKKIFPNGTLVEKYGRIECESTVNRFPISIGFSNPEHPDAQLPLQYATQAKFSASEAKDIRALRLMMMRIGAYGGFTRGVKGIALEQLITQKGDFEATMDSLAQSGDTTPYLPSPLNGKNLMGRVQEDVWHRIRRASQHYITTGELKGSPYNIGDWQSDHREYDAFRLECAGTTPTVLFQQVGKFLSRSNAEGSRHLVIPRATTNEVLVAILQGEHTARQKNDFYRRWTSST